MLVVTVVPVGVRLGSRLPAINGLFDGSLSVFWTTTGGCQMIIRNRKIQEGNESVTNCHQLKTYVADTEQLISPCAANTYIRE